MTSRWMARLLAVGLWVLFSSVSPLLAADDDAKAAEKLMQWQLDAVKADDLPRFQQHGNRAFKEMYDTYTFDGIKMQRGTRLAKGYRLEYLGAIQRLGMVEHLWRVRVDGDKYQLLGRLSVAHDLVVGFDLD